MSQLVEEDDADVDADVGGEDGQGGGGLDDQHLEELELELDRHVGCEDNQYVVAVRMINILES